MESFWLLFLVTWIIAVIFSIVVFICSKRLQKKNSYKESEEPLPFHVFFPIIPVVDTALKDEIRSILQEVIFEIAAENDL
jgi:heme/copper-type cytochrome/quinol oxidase subunit 2